MRGGGKNAASVNAAYRSNFATLGGSYSESSDYRQTGLSGRGSLVAYPWHVLASNETGTTMTIVDAPKAEGLMVNGDESIMTNRDGVALVPYATPYRKNAITLTQTENSAGAEVIGNMANVAPYDGAVSYIRFEPTNASRGCFMQPVPTANRCPLAPKCLMNTVDLSGMSARPAYCISALNSRRARLTCISAAGSAKSPPRPGG